jgi:hypothetical protein
MSSFVPRSISMQSVGLPGNLIRFLSTNKGQTSNGLVMPENVSHD